MATTNSDYDNETCEIVKNLVQQVAGDVFGDLFSDKPVRDLSGIHESDECDCERCQWASEQERQHQERERPRPQPWADAATVRAAIADVLDKGRPCTIMIGCKTGHQWLFDTHDESDSETRRRVAFADAVLARVAQLQQPPHDYPRMEVLCDSHKRRRLPTYSGECVECAEERER